MRKKKAQLTFVHTELHSDFVLPINSEQSDKNNEGDKSLRMAECVLFLSYIIC